MADVLGLELTLVNSQGGASFGMGLLDLVADGVYPSLEEAERILKPTTTYKPNPDRVALYAQRYDEWKRLYPALKPVFPALHK
jgi:xylulokinase